MGAGLDRGEVLNLLLVLVGVVHVAGLEGRGVGVGVLPLQSGINVGLTVVGCVALWKTKWQQERLKIFHKWTTDFVFTLAQRVCRGVGERLTCHDVTKLAPPSLVSMLKYLIKDDF